VRPPRIVSIVTLKMLEFSMDVFLWCLNSNINKLLAVVKGTKPKHWTCVTAMHVVQVFPNFPVTGFQPQIRKFYFGQFLIRTSTTMTSHWLDHAPIPGSSSVSS